MENNLTDTNGSMENIRLTITPLNVNGLEGPRKEMNVKKILTSEPQIVLFQEIHKPDERVWRSYCNNKSYSFHKATATASDRQGVAIAVSKRIKGLTIDQVFEDPSGRYIKMILSYSILQKRIQLINIYSPTRGDRQRQIDFYQQINNIIDPNIPDIIIGGDFNLNIRQLRGERGVVLALENSLSF